MLLGLHKILQPETFFQISVFSSSDNLINLLCGFPFFPYFVNVSPPFSILISSLIFTFFSILLEGVLLKSSLRLVVSQLINSLSLLKHILR